MAPAAVMGHLARALPALLAATGACAQAQAIYTCVDAQGRRLTSDRPILACIDREQKQLNPSGTVRRRIAPAPTAAEQAQLDAQAMEAARERSRLADEKRRDRALLARFPHRDSHERERRAALSVVEAREEKQRINARFDQELARLEPLWAQRAAPATPTLNRPAGAAAAR